MTAIHLHYKSDVGTTYKRALERFHLSRDWFVPPKLTAWPLIEKDDNWFVLITQLSTDPMRRPRDFDSELKALDNKAKRLKDRKLVQLGELVIATGADALPIEVLAGALIAARAETDARAKEAWRQSGAAFFQRSRREATGRTASRDGRTSPTEDHAKPAAGEPDPH